MQATKKVESQMWYGCRDLYRIPPAGCQVEARSGGGARAQARGAPPPAAAAAVPHRIVPARHCSAHSNKSASTVCQASVASE